MNAGKFLLIILLILIYTGCDKLLKKEEKTEDVPKDSVQKTVNQPTPVEGVQISKGTIRRCIYVSGIISGIHEAYIVSETQGKIEKVNFSLGQKVKTGDLLVGVYDKIQKAAYEQAKKAMESAQLNLKVVQKLFDKGSASKAELTNAQTATSGAKTQLISSEKAYNDCRICSPISGYIAQKDKNIEEGNILAGGQFIARIVNLSLLKTTVSIGEMEIGLLKKGMEADIRIPAVSGNVFKGRITAIAAGSDPSTGSFPVEIVWKNPKGFTIKSGMAVKATLKTEISDSLILIPTYSIVDKKDRDAVFTVYDNKALLKFINTGRMSGGKVEIVSGLEPGETLITTGTTKLNDGDSILVTLVGESGGVK